MLTNIDIVDGIDCLQVLQHADGLKKYLTVRTGTSSWKIGNTIDAWGIWIKSTAGAGGGCPPSSSNENSDTDRNQGTSWSYWDGKAYQAADIRVKCILGVTEEAHNGETEKKGA